MFSVS